MSTSDNTGFGTDRQALPLGSRYDRLLAVIPAVFLCGILGSFALSAPPKYGLVAAAAVSVAAIVDGLFLNPPIEGGGR